MKHAVLITHGPIGDAIIEAVRNIMGIDDGLHAITVTQMSLAEITARLNSIVNAPEEKREGVIIMASLRGGSCWNVGATIARSHSHVRLISGVNLPMVLSFMLKRDTMSLDSLADGLVNDGHRSIGQLLQY